MWLSLTQKCKNKSVRDTVKFYSCPFCSLSSDKGETTQEVGDNIYPKLDAKGGGAGKQRLGGQFVKLPCKSRSTPHTTGSFVPGFNC